MNVNSPKYIDTIKTDYLSFTVRFALLINFWVVGDTKNIIDRNTVKGRELN